MRIGVRGRLYTLVALFALGCAALAAALVWLQDQRALEARARQLQSLVEAATGVLEAHKKLADAGVMPEEESRKRALAIIGGMRYGNNDYFIVWGTSPEIPMLMNGRRVDAIGKPQVDQKDGTGATSIATSFARWQDRHFLEKFCGPGGLGVP